MLNGDLDIPSRGKLAVVITWIVASILAVLAGIVVGRRGNLAWDDADYLRRGLANARTAESAGGLKVLLRGFECLLHEGPKPPLLVAWIQIGAMAFSRHNVDLLIVYHLSFPMRFSLSRRSRLADGSMVDWEVFSLSSASYHRRTRWHSAPR